MDKLFEQKLNDLGFKKELENIYSFVIDEKLFTTGKDWLLFIYFENDNYYLSNNGDLVENFDAPDIDIEYSLKEIKKIISEYGCFLDVSRIVKVININNLNEEINVFINAVKSVDNLYKKIITG
ncbi:MAG: hypothetical protein IJX17_06385 [Clostridia bacterium]|nr:hypothetical protein [Clostridia bacterium]